MPDPKKGGEPVAGIPGTDGAGKAPRGVTRVLVRCAAVAGMVLTGWLIGSGVSAAQADLPEPRTSAPHAALLVGGDDLLDVEILPRADTAAELPSDPPAAVGAAPELVPDLVTLDVVSPVGQTLQEPVAHTVEPVLTAVVEPVREIVVEPVREIIVKPMIETVLPDPADQPTTSRATPDQLSSPSTDPLRTGSPAPPSTAPTVEIAEASPAVPPLSQITSPADSFAATVTGGIGFSVPVSPPASAVITSCSGAPAPSGIGSKTMHGTNEDEYGAVPALVAHRVQTANGDLPWSPNERPSTSPD